MSTIDVVGKKGYKKYGYFSGLTGTIERCDSITPYKIVFEGGGSVGAHLKDIVVVEDK
ncbi:hypothetical protein [Paenibacillus medicaginis]|uniref:Jacalin-type lectin domain-containing protein n=1 Tax=Paenibacillus medicaginis TaxID=1470560 RepID=A0ABV5BUE7_9BACL